MFLRLYKRYRSASEQLSDLDIISGYKKDRDPEWIGILFDRYIHLVFGVCMKYLKNEDDSKDAVMQIFEKLLSDLLKYRVNNFKTWLYALTKNHCLMQLRKTTVVKTSGEEELRKINHSVVESFLDLHPSNEKDMDKMLEKLANGITKLSEEQSRCIELMYLKEKSYKEIVSMTGYNLKQVKSYIQNGKRNLKKLLLEDNE